jgi:hypothetical protein
MGRATAHQRLRPGHRPATHRVGLQCVACGITDDHPKHVHAEADGSTTVKHIQCCGCTSCVVHLDHAGDKRGLELAAHIQEHGEEIAEHVAAAHEAAAAAEGSEG